jgi:hypothetical protein
MQMILNIMWVSSTNIWDQHILSLLLCLDSCSHFSRWSWLLIVSTQQWEFYIKVAIYSLICLAWNMDNAKCKAFRTNEGTHGSIVGWGTIHRKLEDHGLIPNEVIGFFNWPNPSSLTMALGFTQLLTEMSTRNLPVGKGRPVNKADVTAICELIA